MSPGRFWSQVGFFSSNPLGLSYKNKLILKYLRKIGKIFKVPPKVEKLRKLVPRVNDADLLQLLAIAKT